MSLIESLVLVGTVFGLFLAINYIIYKVKKNRREFLNTLPIEYYESDKGWWKNW